MNRNISSFFIILTGACLLSSCLNNNDEDETTYYEDTAITAFSVGTINVYHSTKAKDGVTDSLYSTKLTGSTYKFNIDQLQSNIYNPDSLPIGTDAAHVLVTVTTKNSGSVALLNRGSNGQDSLSYFSSTDSLDFTTPRTLRVYNMRGSSYKDYTVNVNVHKQDGDAFQWYSTTVDLSDVGARKFVALGSDLYLFGLKGNSTVGYHKSGTSWQELSVSLDSKAYINMVAVGNYLYTVNNGYLCRSTDGESWNTVGPAQGITQLIGSSDSKLYAITDKGIEYSTDEGNSWITDNIDSDAELLPDEDINFICTPSQVNSNTDNLVLIGNRNGKTMVWSKVDENGNTESTEPWAYFTDDEYNRMTLPYLKYLQVIDYNDGLLAIGGDYSYFYFSQDYGLTWSIATAYTLPSDYAGSIIPCALIHDDNNTIYFCMEGKDNILTGRLAKLGWQTEQKIFK